ncbi:MAG TPA: right-handed parallel beta-helix repeat-containing protein [Chryseosolibacter sp.]
MKTAFLVLLIFSGYLCTAKNYYFSGKGSDDNSGTSKHTPWRNLRKLRDIASTLQPGDSILLERGSVFFGGLSLQADGLPGKEIYIGPYGDGPKPVITGSVEITGWTSYRENIWVAMYPRCDPEPGDVFINGKSQPLGRYPNTGYRTIGSLLSRKAFADPELPFPDNFWDGAEVVVKSSRWTMDNLPAARYRNKTFAFPGAASDTLENGYGYFIQKHLLTLDQSGEWLFDRETGRIFIYHDKNLPSENYTTEVSVSDAGVAITDSEHIAIRDLVIKNQRTTGVVLSHSDNIILSGAEILHSGVNGLVVTGCRSPLVENTRIADSNNNGVEWNDNIDGRLVRNTILRTGIQSGRGASGDGNYIGLTISAGNPLIGKNLIADNRIDSTGYSAIDFRTGNTTIKNNIISNFCLLKDDGGGIYTWNNASGGNTIEANIILNGRGSGEGTPDPAQLTTSGVYIDDRSAGIAIVGNTLAFNSTSGIMVHNANNLEIRGNGFYGNGGNLTNKEKAQLLIRRDRIAPMKPGAIPHIDATDNIFVSVDEGAYCVYISVDKRQELDNKGTFGENLYRAPDPSQAVATLYDESANCSRAQQFTLAQWQKASRQDRGSVFKMINIPDDSRGKQNLVRNSTMDSGITGWVTWPESVRVLPDNTFDGGRSLKVLFPSGGFDALLYHAGIPLEAGKTYRLTFSARSSADTKLEFVPLEAAQPWSALGEYTCFSLDTAFRNYTCYFRPRRTSAEARVNFRSNATFWIDNVALYDITAASEKKDKSLKLLYNTSGERATIPLIGTYVDLDGTVISRQVNLPGHAAVLLFKGK